MAFEDFSAQIAANRFSRPNRFAVKIHCLKLLSLPYFEKLDITDLDIAKRLTLRAESTELPGSSFSTSDVRLFGPIVQYPMDTLYPEVTVTFILGESMKEKYFFDAWMYSIQDPETNNISYSDTYTTDIVIQQLDQNDAVRYQVQLFNAYPLGINSMKLDYGEKDSYGRLEVRFTYKKWINVEVDINMVNQPTLRGEFTTFNSTITPIVPTQGQIKK
jgi:hypothetical protein